MRLVKQSFCSTQLFWVELGVQRGLGEMTWGNAVMISLVNLMKGGFKEWMIEQWRCLTDDGGSRWRKRARRSSRCKTSMRRLNLLNRKVALVVYEISKSDFIKKLYYHLSGLMWFFSLAIRYIPTAVLAVLFCGRIFFFQHSMFFSVFVWIICHNKSEVTPLVSSQRNEVILLMI